MDDDIAFADGLLTAVVVDDGLIFIDIFIPDLDPQGVGIAVAGPDHELVQVAAIVNRAYTLELGRVPADHEPLITLAVEMETRSLKLEVGIAGGNCCTALVLGDEAEVGFTAQGWIILVSACGRIKPAAAGDEAAGRVINNGDGAGGVAQTAGVGDRQADIVDLGRGISVCRCCPSTGGRVAEVPFIGKSISRAC